MLSDLWRSFCALPLWVRVWLMVVLAPLNMATVLFLAEPGGRAVASMAWAGMLLNLPILAAARGFSRAMAFPHIVCWAPLTILIVWLLASGLTGASTVYATFLWALLAVNLVSLAFDARDAVLWLQGAREVPGREVPGRDADSR